MKSGGCLDHRASTDAAPAEGRSLATCPLASRLTLALAATLVVLAAYPAAGLAACSNPVACENEKPGSSPSSWQVTGHRRRDDPGLRDDDERRPRRHDPLQGQDDREQLPHRHLPARLLPGQRRPPAGVQHPPDREPAADPARLPRPTASTGLIDCGNWGVSASWTVPADVGLRRLHRAPRARRHRRRQPDPVRRPRRRGVLGHARPDLRRDLAGLQQVRRQQPLLVHRRRARRATRTPTRARSRSPTTARSTARSRRTAGARTCSTPSTR